MTHRLSRRQFNHITFGLSTLLGLAPFAPSPQAPLGALTAELGVPRLLRVAPFFGPSWWETGVTFSYANLALQLESVGVDPIDDISAVDDDARRPWYYAIQELPLVHPFFQYLLAPEWRSVMGFAPGQVEHMAMVGTPPQQATILRGRFDRVEIWETLTGDGYRSEDIDGTEVLRIRADNEVDPGDIRSLWWHARANNIALLDDTTIALASTEADITAVINASGNNESLADQPDIAALFPTELEALAGAVGITGGSLASISDPTVMLDPDIHADAFATAEAEQAASPQLPSIRQSLFGTTPGGPLDYPSNAPPTLAPGETIAQAQIRALFLDQSAAESAAPIIEERLATGRSTYSGRSWSDILDRWEIDIVGDEGLVVIRIEFPGQIYQLYNRQEVGFLSWPY